VGQQHRVLSAPMAGRRRRRATLALVVALGAFTAAPGGPVADVAAAHARDVHLRAATVRAVQRALGLRADGIYGRLTRAAVRRFQRRHGLTVDGIAGPQTLRALGLGRAAARAGRARSTSSVRATLARIAQCESGGDPRAVSPGGRYRGKYQFSLATWQALGGRGDPAAASERAQDRMAARLLRLRGTSPWPNCA
jgi:Transglycosylase-like domain/Putative peptidoglycan binding domain